MTPGSLLGVAIAMTAWAATARADDTRCGPGLTTVVVDTAARVMTLCEDGAAVGEFAVAIGGGGVGKQREGDGKTPLGSYLLGAPRRSSDYGTFIPIGFPTAHQRKRGFSGGAIGIHGPDRRLRMLGQLAVTLGWTRGCVAVASDDQMKTITTWVGQLRRRQALSIEIR